MTPGKKRPGFLCLTKDRPTGLEVRGGASPSVTGVPGDLPIPTEIRKITLREYLFVSTRKMICCRVLDCGRVKVRACRSMST